MIGVDISDTLQCRVLQLRVIVSVELFHQRMKGSLIWEQWQDGRYIVEIDTLREIGGLIRGIVVGARICESTASECELFENLAGTGLRERRGA